MLLSAKLWIPGSRLFPVLKPFDIVLSLSACFDGLFLVLFIDASIIWLFCKRRLPGIVAITSLLTVLLQDQMRWQPWVYLYLLLLVPFLSQSKSSDDKTLKATLQIIVAGVYVWSGIHKLNTNFIDLTFSQMMQDLGCSINKNVGYLLPVIEISIGFLLLIPKLRKPAVCAAVAMHVVILLYLSQLLHQNTIVYPWNIAMIVFVFLLYYKEENNPVSLFRKSLTQPTFLFPIILVWVFPALNLVGYWDHYLSFSLYSDKPAKYYIAIEETEVYKLDKNYAPYYAEINGLQGGRVIDLDKWALSELNVPFYPEMRFFKKLSTGFCRLGIENDKLIFLEMVYSQGKQEFRSFKCSDFGE